MESSVKIVLLLGLVKMAINYEQRETVKLCLSKQLSCCERLSVNINLKSIGNSTDQYKQFIGLVPNLFFYWQRNFYAPVTQYLYFNVSSYWFTGNGVNSKISSCLLP